MGNGIDVYKTGNLLLNPQESMLYFGMNYKGTAAIFAYPFPFSSSPITNTLGHYFVALGSYINIDAMVLD